MRYPAMLALLALFAWGCDRAEEEDRSGVQEDRDGAAESRPNVEQDESFADKLRRAGRQTADRIRSLGQSRVGATVEMTGDHKFEPATVTIQVGESVAWKNTSDHIHTVSVDLKEVKDPSRVSIPRDAAPFHSGNIRRGETFQQAFMVAGTYRYVCVLHEDQGMGGTVVVKPQE